MRTCTHCKQDLPLECFHRRLDGRLTICKHCAKEKRQAKQDPLQDQIKEARAQIREVLNIKRFEKLESVRAKLARVAHRTEQPIYIRPVSEQVVPAFIRQLENPEPYVEPVKVVEKYIPQTGFLDQIFEQSANEELAKALQVLKDADEGIY